MSDSPTFCKQHQYNHGGKGCPYCQQNQQDKPYRGTARSVLVEQDVVMVKKMRQDLVIQEQLTRNSTPD